MNPGLPGMGIGGLFYTLSALFMPVCEVRRRLRGDGSGRGALVARQFAIAVGVVAVMTGVFWTLDVVFMLGQVVEAVCRPPSVWSLPLRVSALLVTSGVLATVLGTVQIVRLWQQPRAVSRAAR